VTGSRLRIAAHCAIVIAAALGAARAAAAQDMICDPGDTEVRSVRFEGNRTFDDGTLERQIATTSSTWSRRHGLPFGERRCLDSLEFQRDRLRLRSYYYQRGYRNAEVDTALQVLSPGVVRVTFRVREGVPMRIDTLTVLGLDTIPGGERLKRLIGQMQGAPLDIPRMVALGDTVELRLRNSGYALAQRPLRGYQAHEATNSASVTFEFLPGHRYHIGRVLVDILPLDSTSGPQITPDVVRQLLSFSPGDLYRERELDRSRRTLYQLETFQHVDIAIAPDSLQPPGDSLLDIQVRLSEAPMRSVRLGIGWATLDCIRAQARLTHRNFLGDARRLELTSRVSKVGVGHPLGGAEVLCADRVRHDRFSDTLNYYVGASLRTPTLFGPRNVPSLTLYSERRSELDAYLRSTPFGGALSVTREQNPTTPITLAYSIEFGKTVADPAVFCSAFNVCNLQDIDALNGQTNRLAVLSATVGWQKVTNVFDPRGGYQATVDVRHASKAIGSESDLQFNKAGGAVAVYRPVGDASVLAMRLQLGAVFARGSLGGAAGAAGERFVPPQERLYAGGPNSVRGFNQNQLGPVVYVVDSVRKVQVGTTTDSIEVADDPNPRVSATGGDLLAVANLELRSRGPVLRDLVEWALFMDVGQVWNRDQQSVSVADLRWTPGVGLRVSSPVGPVRVDVAYNPYQGRRGAAFKEVTVDGERQLVCVSPRSAPPPPDASSADCPATFAPPAPNNFFSRLTFHFSIGQAF
jgi:outer membrane protein insertion porin family/translocation and assembly module TamA